MHTNSELRGGHALRVRLSWQGNSVSSSVHHEIHEKNPILLMTAFGPPEHVYVENEWYDGPRAGVADVNGRPHRFVSQFDEDDDDFLGTFLVWPIEADELLLEQEQWRIFVSWNDEYEAGRVGATSHPGHPGTCKRWDEIASLLKVRRKSVPATAVRARAQVTPIEGEQRYPYSGPAYRLSWRML